MPPQLHQVEPTELRDQHGKLFTGARLRGKVWVANVMFTTCPTVCPLMTEQMMGIKRELDAHNQGVHFVSVSIDPETDTPAQLRSFIKDHGVNDGNWTFVTGDLARIRRFVSQGLKLSAGQRTKDGADISHSIHFVLVDRSMRVRGYYRSNAEGRRKLIEAATTLLNTPADEPTRNEGA